MTTLQIPEPELLRKLLRYEPETGKLFWQKRDRNLFPTEHSYKRWNLLYGDSEAFTAGAGYKQGKLFGRLHYAHRVIWAIQTGEWPTKEIDHIDLNRSNNAWCNLREATKSQNQANRKPKPNSSSRYLGVSWNKQLNKWHVVLSKNKKLMHLGYFDCEITAALFYDAAALDFHGEFANLNFPEKDAA